MQDKSRNIYYNARKAAGLTQERWAEMLGLSVEAVRQYETDRITPSDDVVARMAELSMLHALGYWHLRNKSRLAAEQLPAVERMPLAQAVCQLLVTISEFETHHRGDRLMKIAADGKVDELEAREFGEILSELNVIVQAAMQLKFAEQEERR